MDGVSKTRPGGVKIGIVDVNSAGKSALIPYP